MRIGQISELSSTWTEMSSSSSPGASLESEVVSKAPEKYAASLKMDTPSLATLYPSEKTPLDPFNEAGIHPGFAQMSISDLLVKANVEAQSASEASADATASKESSSAASSYEAVKNSVSSSNAEINSQIEAQTQSQTTASASSSSTSSNASSSSVSSSAASSSSSGAAAKA